MRIEIEVPKEFEKLFNQDRFKDNKYRLGMDAHLIAGNYEQEIAIMLIKTFKNTKITERCKGIKNKNYER
jgi:hypothetical protein